MLWRSSRLHVVAKSQNGVSLSPTMWTMRRLSSGGIDESDAMGTGSGGSTDIRVSNEDERHHGFRLPFFMRRGKILCDQPHRAQVDPTTSLNFDLNSKKKSPNPLSLPNLCH